jgi:hypothetical protein
VVVLEGGTVPTEEQADQVEVEVVLPELHLLVE